MAAAKPHATFLTSVFVSVLVVLQISLMAFAKDPLPQLIDAIGLGALVAGPFVFLFSTSTPQVRRFFGLYIAYLICLAISTAITGNPYVSKLEAFGLDLLVDSKAYAIALVMFALVPPSALERCFRRVLWILLIVGLINLPFVVRDVFSATSIHGVPLPSRSGFHTPVGLFDIKIKSAHYQLLAMIAAMALRMDPKLARYPGWKTLVAVLALSVAVHLSVKELTAMAVVLMIYTTLRKGRQFGLTATLILVLLSAFLVLSTVDTPIKAAFIDRIGRFLGETRGQTVRTAAYVGSFQLSSEYFPFGTGASTFMSKGARDLAYSPFYIRTGIAYLWGGSPQNPIFIMDTFWPKILGQSGWSGFIAYVGATISMIVWSLRLFHRESTATTFAAAAILSSILTFSFATPAYTHDHLILPAAISFALVLSYSGRRRAGRRVLVLRAPPQAGPRHAPMPRGNGRSARV